MREIAGGFLLIVSTAATAALLRPPFARSAGVAFSAMAKLRTLKPKLPTLPSRMKSATTRDVRMTGRALQSRRLRIWSRNPHCAMCGRLVAYPEGFELDHKVPLFLGGLDTDENCQVLCVDYDRFGQKIGCHAQKTAREVKG